MDISCLELEGKCILVVVFEHVGHLLQPKVIQGQVNVWSFLYNSLCRWNNNQSGGRQRHKSICRKPCVNNTCYNNTGDVNQPLCAARFG